MAKLLKLVCLLLLAIVSTIAAQVGGWHKLDTNNNEVQALAKSAVTEIDKSSNSMYRNQMVKVVKAESQVVAGINYRLVVDVVQSDCKKSDPDVEVEKCGVSDQNVQRCTISFWVQPWLKSQKIQKLSCKAQGRLNKTPKPRDNNLPLLGGASDADPASQEAVQAAMFAVDQINAKSNNLRKMVLMDIKNVQKQTVAGIKWKMILELGQSNCLNRRQATQGAEEDCSPQEGQSETCAVEVLEQKWSDKRFSLLSDKCEKTPDHMDTESDSADASMDQKPPILGGDDHDIGNRGEFEEFKQTFNKVYENKKEEVKRFSIFRANMKKAKKLQESEKGTATYGVTKFADLSPEEFRENYLSPVWDVSVAETMDKATIPAVAAPKAWDWREHDAVTAVKNQGMCGSCWAFSTTGNIEGQWAIKKKNLLSLSEQELVDCDKVDQGCNGGLPANAYKAIEKLGGLESETEYPYEGKGEKCEFSEKEAVAYINGSVTISSDEDDMMKWLYQNGPISIGINANAMQYYTGGVSHPWSLFCNPNNLDHGVLIVGYGTASGWFGPTPYWIVKNSWGANWGEKGYYRVYRGKGVCGLNKMPTSSVIN